MTSDCLQSFSEGNFPQIPQISFSLLRKGLWLAQVPENSPFFFNKSFIAIPAKDKRIIKNVIRKSFIIITKIRNKICKKF